MKSQPLFEAFARNRRVAVIDTETTGFSRYDRIVEFACVTMVDGEIVEEYETLIQPDRDPGPVHIHGITPTMLEAAPDFVSVAGDIAARLDGALLVAHNISYDLRMIGQEVARVPAMTFRPGVGICTYRLSGQKLSVAARQAGVTVQPDHTALNDARAAAEVLMVHSRQGATADSSPASCRSDIDSVGFTVRRPGAPPRRGALSMLALRTAWPSTTTEAEVLYLDTLDRCLDDGELSRDEQAWLDSTARALQVSEEHREDMHRRYYDLLVRQILADGIVTREERDMHDKVAAALMIGEDALGGKPEPDDVVVEPTPGMAVCFTGVATVDGEPVSRPILKGWVEMAGMRPVGSVTKKNCDLLVAADVRSRSGKARKARQYGIPVVDAAEFMRLLARGRV